MSEPYALYVHVPWCRHVCPYCDFNVYAASAPPADEYVAVLAAELAHHATRAPWVGRAVRTVYLGGGTPSLLPPAAVGRLLEAVATRTGIVPGAEVTLEANPGTVTRASLAGYLAAGVNRLSLGAQSFQPALLRVLGRDHAPEDTRAAVAAATGVGLGNVSLDLIYAVPGETLAAWEDDLALAIALSPVHVSAYALTWESGTPFHAWRAAGRLAPVDEDLEAAMAETALARLEAAGCERYEISSYARPGFASQHNTSYWDGSDYLGLGAGAHSFSRRPPPGRRWLNEAHPEPYAARVRAAGAAVAHEEHLSEAQARAEFCWTGLRRVAGVDLDAFGGRFGTGLLAAFPHVPQLVADGLVELAGSRLRLTAHGFRFADAVAATFT